MLPSSQSTVDPPAGKKKTFIYLIGPSASPSEEPEPRRSWTAAGIVVVLDFRVCSIPTLCFCLEDGKWQAYGIFNSKGPAVATATVFFKRQYE